MKKTYIIPILNVDDIEVCSLMASSMKATSGSTDIIIDYGEDTDLESIDFMD